MGNVIIVAVLALIIIIAVKSSLRHLKGEGSCCGGGSTIKEPDKKLSGTIINTKVFRIEGMHCENCKNSVERHVNKMDGASCVVDLKKKLAVVSYDREIDENRLRKVIELLDFTVTGIEEA